MASNLEVGNVKASGGAETNVTVKSSAANCFYELGETSGTKSWRIKASGGDLYFQHDDSNADFTSGTNLVTIDSAGLVKVSKGHTGTFTALSLGNTSTSANDNVSLELQAAGLGAPARIEAEAPGGSDTDLAFYTVNGGSAGLAMRLDADGAATFSNGIDISSGFLTVGDYSELTIASGVITVTASLHNVDTESDAATDDLDTINGGAEGTILHFSPTNASRTVVAKDGTGNLRLAGDFTMDNSTDVLTLIKTGSNWFEVSRSNNAG